MTQRDDKTPPLPPAEEHDALDPAFIVPAEVIHHPRGHSRDLTPEEAHDLLAGTAEYDEPAEDGGRPGLAPQPPPEHGTRQGSSESGG